MRGKIILGIAAALLIQAAGRAEDWPCFRGPTRQGVSAETGLPTAWSATENVAWKTAIPGAGWSSPIVFGDRVFVTTTTDEGASCRVLSLDRATGRVLWNTEVFRQVPKNKQGKNSYATPTPATDGKLVYAVFAGGSFAALRFDGSVAWVNHDFPYYSQHGLGNSPILYEDLLIMPFDGSSEGDDKTVGWRTPWDRGLLVALDKATGRVRWKGSRGQSRIAHATPNVFTQGGKSQIVSGAGDVVQGFDPATGRRLWSVYSQGEGVVPSIVVGDGLVFTASGFEDPTIRVVRPGGLGDGAEAAIVWESKKAVPAIPSFLYVDGLLYTIDNSGVAQCFEGKTGEIVWQERIGGNHSASPVYADGKIYYLSEDGESTIIEAGREFRIIARNSIGQRCQASYAVSQGRIFIRSEKHLFAIGKPAVP